MTAWLCPELLNFLDQYCTISKKTSFSRTTLHLLTAGMSQGIDMSSAAPLQPKHDVVISSPIPNSLLLFDPPLDNGTDTAAAPSCPHAYYTISCKGSTSPIAVLRVQTQMFEVTVPLGVSPNQLFRVIAHRQRQAVRCPPNAHPGQRIRFRLPIIERFGNHKSIKQGKSTPKQLQSMIGGLENKSSLKVMVLCYSALSSVGAMNILCSYLKEASGLEHLGFLCNKSGATKAKHTGEYISAPALSALTSVLSQTKIKGLTLARGGLLGPANDWKSLAHSFKQLNHLQEIQLLSCGIGNKECLLLAQLLQSEGADLSRLNLNSNCIDDSCCSILATSLRGNRKLERLDLDGNRSITSAGLEDFLQLVCNTANIKHTVESNHTLSNLGDNGSAGWSNSRSSGLALLKGTQVHNKLKAWLNCNGSPLPDTAKSRRKVMHAHFTDHIENAHGAFPVGQLFSLNAKLMPRMLALFSAEKEFPLGGELGQHQSRSKPSYLDKGERFRALHRILCHCNIPELFSFPFSEAERLRISEYTRNVNAKNVVLESKINELEDKISSLEELVKELQEERAKSHDRIRALLADKSELDEQLNELSGSLFSL